MAAVTLGRFPDQRPPCLYPGLEGLFRVIFNLDPGLVNSVRSFLPAWLSHTDSEHRSLKPIAAAAGENNSMSLFLCVLINVTLHMHYIETKLRVRLRLPVTV
ncbi:hypothetical protein chiPu_0019215 [Chiloscyllium punctatum]|uniref:Uncharacterized protein n=1 Tax=Chiloscyllium punctatum TaxID=137246 RepID=A0A401RRE4_CHIPU|nr:hypothetical protein [Chiloscyllium punctatum]